jgi:hypothetical protein
VPKKKSAPTGAGNSAALSTRSTLKDDAASLVRAKLAGSLLDDDDRKLLKIAPAKPGVLSAMGLPEKKAMEIPYFYPDGRQNGFIRWRYLEDTRDGLDRQTKKKPLRYVQQPGTLQGIYLPPYLDWRILLADPTMPIVITEGELKAACATKHGHACIGLGGVFSFKSTQHKIPLLAELAGAAWKGRRVVIAYDSDAATNPEVVRARNELAKELSDKGGSVQIAAIPAGEKGAKRGLDDLALEEGPEAMASALEEAEAFSLCAELWRLNGEVAYVRDPGVIAEVATGRLLRPYDFQSSAYANRHVYEAVVTNGGGTRMEKRPAARAWLEWPERAELERLAYVPGDANRITADRELNSWQGWGCQPVKGNVAPWRELLDHLFTGAPDSREWFQRWCALPLQRPGAKM